ncbi:hypothetical protein JTE90_012329, partial [Oedothorax gibbosus]
MPLPSPINHTDPGGPRLAVPSRPFSPPAISGGSVGGAGCDPPSSVTYWSGSRLTTAIESKCPQSYLHSRYGKCVESAFSWLVPTLGTNSAVTRMYDFPDLQFRLSTAVKHEIESAADYS